ncbi:TPA: helix-turn-helix domain-containing protein, partial [Enterococcus faecium]
METIIQIMKKYDFSEMETRVYTTLLEKGNLTGYEVSKISGVPRSKVYNILEKLLKKNLIVVNKS